MSRSPYQALAEQFDGPDLEGMLSVIRAELPKQIERLHDALQQRDSQLAKQVAHRLKSTLMLMSDSSGQNHCQCVEHESEASRCLAMAQDGLLPHTQRVLDQLNLEAAAAGY